jgi:crotonobetainyl-CoA:carnitine CoA-transferase CaiB-like acyl-CoA transferase
MNCAGGYGSQRYGAPSRTYPCLDGHIEINVLENHQWLGVAQALGRPELGLQYGTIDLRLDHASEIDSIVSDWTSDRSKKDCEELLQAEGVPATATSEIGDLINSTELSSRGTLVGLSAGSSTLLIDPLKPHQGPGVSKTRDRPRLGNLRIVEFTQVLAGPLAGALLGAMGAVITKVESSSRPEMYRRLPPYIDGHQDLEWSAYFAMANHSKIGHLVDYDDDSSIQSLIAGHDVVLENLGKARSERLQVDSVSVGLSYPEQLAVSISGFGHSGSSAGFRAYAPNIHAACGLTYLTTELAQSDVSIGFPFADVISSYTVATFIAAWAIGDGMGAGRGATIDLSMAEVAASRLNEFLLDLQQHHASVEIESESSIDGIYMCNDATWVAVSVKSTSEWARLRSAWNIPGQATPRLDDLATRQDDPVSLDLALREVFGTVDATSITSLLRSLGIFARPVLSHVDVISDPDFRHPLWGRRRLLGLPWQFVGEERSELGPPPVITDAAGEEERSSPN